MAARPILTLLATCAITSAHAAPRSDPTNGRAVFTGATVPNASSITLNPAALGLGTVGEIFVALTSTLDHYRIDRYALDGEPTTVRVRDIEPGVGGIVAAVLRAGERSTVGFEVKIQPPEQLGPENDKLRFHSAGGTQRDYIASISASFKVTSRIFFGASLSHDTTRLKLRYALDEAMRNGAGPDGIDSDCGGAPCGFENPLATETYDVDVRSPYIGTANLEVNIGVAVRLADGVWLGAAYHTPPGFDIQTALDGDMTVTRSARDGGGRLAGGSTVNIAYPASVDAEVVGRLPGLLDLHVGGRWLDLSRFQAFDVRGYGSTFPGAEIPEWTLRARGLHDSVALWSGVEQVDVGQPVRLGGRLGVESSSLDDRATTPLTISPGSLTIDGGMQVRVAPNWVMQLTYGVQYFPKVTVTESEFDPRHQVDCVAADYDYTSPACESVRNGFATPTANGSYTRFQHAMRLAFRYEID